jgi:5-hydroxyisourate hydrolase-like protein (transthyretin family)
MRQHFRVRLIAFVAVLGLAVSSLAAGGQDAPKRGRKYKAPPATARIEVTVLRDVNGKPIENAAVVFHPMEGEKDTGNMELKTNEDGKTVIDVLPMGDTVRLQIIAKGFQTYGEDYKIDKPEMAIEIKMKRPGEQYSVYKNHDGTVDTGKSSDGANPAQAAPDAGAAKPDNSKPKSGQSPAK